MTDLKNEDSDIEEIEGTRLETEIYEDTLLSSEPEWPFKI